MDALSYMTLFLAVATVFLAVIAVWSNLQTRKIHQKELKIRLLDKIVQWAIDVQNSTLSINIPVVGDVDRKKVEANVLLKYAIEFTKNEYIKAIASEQFGKDLRTDIQNAIDIFTVFMFIKGRAYGINAKGSFGGSAIILISNAEEQINEGKVTVDELLDKYSRELSRTLNGVLVKVGNITAALLSS
jgi:hypothetical protein